MSMFNLVELHIYNISDSLLLNIDFLGVGQYQPGASEESTTQIKHDKTPKHHHLLLEYLFNLPCSQCAILYMNQNTLVFLEGFIPQSTQIRGRTV